MSEQRQDPAPGSDEVSVPSGAATPGDHGVLPEPAAPAAPIDRAAADASLLALVDRLAAILERSDLAELEVEADGTALVLRSPAPTPPPVDGQGPGRPSDPGVAGGRQDLVGPRGAAAANAILAPLTGVFYASPNPGSPAFVAPGREVAIGQVVGLIEAMKLFNEIKSDRAGRVVRLLAENGALVRARQPLVEVEPL